jgi:predicted SnoaL-like aldol condensation-catalyzing enzyme
MAEPSPKEKTVELLRSIETGNQAAAAAIDPANYRQHNLAVGDGIQGFAEVMQQLPRGSARVATLRVFQDGDMVFTHSDYNFFGPKIGFDIFRFENGRIVEHWDNLQETPKKPNPSGRTMTDGPTEVRDLSRTDANKAVVRAFMQDVLIGGKMDQLPNYFDGDRYVQHNPNIGDGVSGLGAALAGMAKAGMALKISQLHRVLGEGNFVLAVSEGFIGPKAAAFYDLFRLENGKIVEHWDVVEPILPKSQWKHANGKF